MRPRYMTAIRSAKWAAVERSCVIIEHPHPVLPETVEEAEDPARTETSSIETGSSAIRSFGSSTSAAAIATRWRWPPESSCG